jgi:hypothetical protein
MSSSVFSKICDTRYLVYHFRSAGSTYHGATALAVWLMAIS